jgi:hypothetical protein
MCSHQLLLYRHAAQTTIYTGYIAQKILELTHKHKSHFTYTFHISHSHFCENLGQNLQNQRQKHVNVNVFGLHKFSMTMNTFCEIDDIFCSSYPLLFFFIAFAT